MADRPGLLEMLGQTWPARMAKSAWEAAKLPGDVYAGKVDPLSDEGIGRAADLGGMVMGGTFAGAPAGAMGAGAVKPIRAYHGSPHDFDRFDLSKIGTGEGAQAYGHGLYFAENPATAQSYRDTLAPSRGKLPDDIISLPPEMRQAIMTHAGTDVDAATAAKRAQYMSSALRKDDLAKVTDMVERARLAKQGRMYEVNINADPAHMLDWDKALNQQGPEVTAALQQAMRPRQWQEFSPAQAGTAIKQGFIGLDERIASEKLRDAGLPGIKYLDQGSRGVPTSNGRVQALGGKFHIVDDFGTQAGPFDTLAEAKQYLKPMQQTSNYVLFRDDIIDIVKKYGLAGAAAMYGISKDEAKAALNRDYEGDKSDRPPKPDTKIGRKTYADEE